MADNENHSNTFSASDIERYHSGNMSPQDMHALEKAALDDPFLADALEGYRYSQQPAEDMRALNASLQDRLSKGKVVPMNDKSTQRQWLRVAALFVLLAGAGWLLYHVSFSSTSDNVAATATLPAKKESSPSDTASNAIAEEHMEGPEATAKAKDENKAGAQTKPLEKAETKETVSARQKVNTESGDKNTNAVATTLSTSNRNPAMNEMYRKAADSNAVASMQREGDAGGDTTNKDLAAAQQQTIVPGKENVIVLQRSKSDPIPEVVLSKNRGDTALHKPKIVFEEAEPEKGEIYYNDYLAEHLKLPEAVQFKAPAGEVRLSFDVNDVGEPINIRVEKSLCEECDKEAIRILKEGPKLVKKKKGKKGKASIRF